MATVAVAVIALLALIYAKYQVDHMRKANEETMRQARYRVLMDLDARWESEEMQNARKSLVTLRRLVLEEMDTAYKHLDEPNKKAKRKERYCELLFQMRDQQHESYQDFMKTWGFAETMGYMYFQKYVELQDIEEIFGTVVFQLDDMSRLHIQQRDEELSKTMGTSAKLYSNFLDLASELRGQINQ